MKKVLTSMLLLMLCIGSTAQDKLFEEGISRGRAARQFYYAKNGKGKGQTLDKLRDYAMKHNYLIGHYTTKEIDRFGDKETAINEFFFLPKSEYTKFVFEFISDNYSFQYNNLKQTGSCWLYQNENFYKMNNVKWSGTVVNGLLTGKGTGAYKNAEGTSFYYIEGEFQNGLPLGKLTVKYFNLLQGKKPSDVKFLTSVPATVGKLSGDIAKYQDENGKWGFVTSDGKIAVRAKYESVLKDFANGRAEVVYDGKEIVIGKDGAKLDVTANQKRLDAAQAAKEKQEQLKKQQEQRNRELAERQRRIERERQEAEAERIRVEKFKKCQPGDIIYYSQSYVWEEGWIFKSSHSASWRVVCYVEKNLNNGERLQIRVGDVETSGDRYRTPRINGIEYRRDEVKWIKPLQDKNWHIE